MGFKTGTTFTIEEVRLEWLPLSLFSDSYVPPFDRFFIKHYAKLQHSGEKFSGQKTLYSIEYDKKFNESAIQVEFSVSLDMVVSVRDNDHIISILFDNRTCSNPGPIRAYEYVNSGPAEIINPYVIFGICRGMPAGNIIVDLVVENLKESSQSAGSLSKPHAVIEEIYEDFIKITN